MTPDRTEKKPNHKKYLPWLFLGFALFLFRVLAQLLQKYAPIAILPPFEAWYSGALTYPWLLASQGVILTLMTFTLHGFTNGTFLPKRQRGLLLLLLGGIYLSVMIFRLIAGFTFAADHPWLGAHIPAFFHIVLVSFVLLVGHFNYSQKITGKQS